MKISFTVFGEAQPAGSKRAFARPGMRFPVVIDANPKAKVWKESVAREAARAAKGEMFDGPVLLDVVFYRVRPKSDYGTGRNAAQVKPSAPSHPITRPDRTKLLRGLEDACTGILWRDDSQVVDGRIRKEFGHPARVEVVVEGLTAGNSCATVDGEVR